MTDRELLEMAAKAAGLKVAGDGGNGRLRIGRPVHVDAEGWQHSGEYGWNPLVDDGDALRLAVKLGMAVSVEFQVGSTAVLWGPPVDGTRELHSGNPLAATRRAIVRAAAELGRAK